MNAFTFWAPSMVDGDVLVVDLAGQLYRFDAATGARAWDFALNEPVYRGSPLVVGSVAVVGTVDGQIVAFDLASGDVVARSTVAQGPIRELATDGSAIVAVTAGNGGGLSGIAHDPAESLIREHSPTILTPIPMLARWAAAAVPLCLGAFLVGTFLWARLGPVQLAEEGFDAEGEDQDQAGDGPEEGGDA